MSYVWIFPPLPVVGYEYDRKNEQECSYDDLSNVDLPLRPADIPEASRALYPTRYFENTVAAQDLEEQPDVDVILGFFLTAGADLDSPRAADVFVAYAGPERTQHGTFSPVGEHAPGGLYRPGDRLISVQDYLKISAGLNTPEVYVSALVQANDPYAQLTR